MPNANCTKNHFGVAAIAAFLTVATLAACDTDSRPRQIVASVSSTVGAGGGTIAGPAGAVLAVPAGATGTDTLITVSQLATASAPNGTAVVGVPIRLEPAGKDFNQPVSLTIVVNQTALPAGTAISDVVVMRAPQGTKDFVPLPTTVSGPAVVAVTEHFSDFIAVVVTNDGGSLFGACGDRYCDATSRETCDTCPYDCGLCFGDVGDVCYNGVCDSTETCSTCAYDCGGCGNGVCATNNGGCDPNASCLDEGGRAICSCPAAAYDVYGDGTYCANAGFCDVASCSMVGECIDSDGFYTCTCPPNTSGLQCQFGGSGEVCTTSAECGANASCIDVAGFNRCVCNSGYAGDGYTCSQTAVLCDPMTDLDLGTLTFTVANLGVASGDGFNLDGLDNSSVAGGANVAGCGRADAIGGIDNGFGSIATSLASVIDLSAALQESIAPTNPDASVGAMGIGFVVTNFGGGTNDPCVGIEATVTFMGFPITTYGYGAIVNNVLTGSFYSPIALPAISPPLPSASCVGGICNPAGLPLVLDAPRIRISLDASQTAALPGSVLGGTSFFEDCYDGTYIGDYCEGGTFGDQNGTGLKESIRAWATTANLDPNLTTTFMQAFAGGLDLRWNGGLEPCTGPNISSTNRNAISVGLSFDSIAP